MDQISGDAQHAYTMSTKTYLEMCIVLDDALFLTKADILLNYGNCNLNTAF